MRVSGYLVLLLAVLYTLGGLLFVAEHTFPEPCPNPIIIDAILLRPSSPSRLRTTMNPLQNIHDVTQPVRIQLPNLPTQPTSPETHGDRSTSYARAENFALDSSNAVPPLSLDGLLPSSTLTSRASWRVSPFLLLLYFLHLLFQLFFASLDLFVGWIFSRAFASNPTPTIKSKHQHDGGTSHSSPSMGWLILNWLSNRRPRRRRFTDWMDTLGSRVVIGTTSYLQTFVLALTTPFQLFVNRTAQKLPRSLAYVCH